MSAAQSADETLSDGACFWAPSSFPPLLPLSPDLSRPPSSRFLSPACRTWRLCLSPCVAFTFSVLLMKPLYLCHTLSLHHPPTPLPSPPPPSLIDVFFPLPRLLWLAPPFPPSSGKCATLIAASLMFARMLHTALASCQRLTLERKQGDFCDQTQSFVPAWKRCFPVSASVTHDPASRGSITGGLWLCSIPSPNSVLPFSISPSWG